MKKRFTIDKRVAVLLLSIDEDLAAEVLRHLADDRVDQVSRAMQELQDIDVGRSMVSEIYAELLYRMRSGDVPLGDVDAQMESVLVKAFGAEAGGEVNQRAKHEILARRPFAMFESLAADDLADLLVEEHPQIAAVFLAHLDQAKGGQVLAKIPKERRADLVHRVATLDRTPPDMVQRVLEVMRAKVKELGMTSLRAEPHSWVKTAAKILNHAGDEDNDVLAEIEDQDPSLARQIRDEMFTFDELALLDGRSIQKVLSQIDTQTLALSLKSTSKSVEDNIFRNLSQRAAALVIEEREILGLTPIVEVREAQEQVVRAVRGLMECGEITFAGEPEELV